MTDAVHAFWESYARGMANAIGLRDWDVQVDRGVPDDAYKVASVGILYGQKRLRIYLSEQFYAKRPEEQRETVLHELMHAHLEGLDETVRLYAKNREGAEVELFTTYYRQHSEFAVDGLATALAPLFALPGEQP